ncbi:hypothetical protein PN441_14365 [Spirulina major CS-329]|uniref:hypothetical protein n=1 Tax=Spirulina TaxID=1154 RepID=UPI00232FD485|nr:MULTISPECIES: hypothetical protein [Spirulina]MDB9496212.1 hypothetical protein [Spirulina subsalsa CS-330]MDB9504258.1 hypothetical protein [Spirulina major CS-329]
MPPPLDKFSRESAGIQRRSVVNSSGDRTPFFPIPGKIMHLTGSESGKIFTVSITPHQ